ncbi:MAG: heme lyase CcmF/NrfE family subunit [Hellea sp.]|nr:heme lyase CcmF/NrfE family subunit [Hellea sp.]
MIAELGHILLISALIIAVFQTVLPLWGAHQKDKALMAFGSRAAILQALALIGAFALLTTAFVTSDFSVLLAADHSHTAKPLLYKITGVWANHEGSILLWVLILAIYGAMVPIFGKALPDSLKARAIGIQGLLCAGFLGFVLFTSNPFERISPMPQEGLGLNPLLQDPGLAFHPPFLYLGYVGFSLSFSFACAALIEGKVDAIWARWLRPWVLLAWSFMTIGITLGSLWAYYELGWGGWWMWDPVENVSFMPWLAGTALLHSISVLGTRHTLPSWTVLLAITTFSLSLIGTFVVRSGLLMSVHTFAEDPKRGLYLLVLLAIYTGAALWLYGLRAKELRSQNQFEPVSRSGALVINNLLLVVATATVFLGTFYPVFVEAVFNYRMGSNGEGYFNMTFIPIMSLLILVMGFGPLLKWERDKWPRLKTILPRLLLPAMAIVLLAAIFGKSFFAALGLGLAGYLAIGVLLAIRNRRQQIKQQTAAFWGFVFGHLGLAVVTMAITVMVVWGADKADRVQIGETIELGAYEFTLTDVTESQRDNYAFIRARIDVSKNGHALDPLFSERRYYPARQMWTSEAGLDFKIKDTIFAAINDKTENGWVMRVYHHPMIVWIWIGGLMIALAGFISLADRRLRLRDETEAVMS